MLFIFSIKVLHIYHHIITLSSQNLSLALFARHPAHGRCKGGSQFHSFARRPKGVAKPLPLTVIASSNVAAERRRSRCSTGEAGGEPSTGGGGSEGEGGVLEMCDQCQRRVSPAAAGVTICLPTSHQRVLVICSVLRLLVLAPICSPT